MEESSVGKAEDCRELRRKGYELKRIVWEMPRYEMRRRGFERRGLEESSEGKA